MTTAKVVLISAVMSLVGTFLGFALNTATSGSGTASSDIAALNQRIQYLEVQLGLSITTAVPTTTEKPAASATPKPTKKITAKPGVTPKTTAKPEVTPKTTASPTTSPSTGTTLTTTIAKKGAACNPQVNKVPVGALSCNPVKGKPATIGKWGTTPSKGTSTNTNTGTGASTNTGASTGSAPAGGSGTSTGSNTTSSTGTEGASTENTKP